MHHRKEKERAIQTTYCSLWLLIIVTANESAPKTSKDWMGYYNNQSVDHLCASERRSCWAGDILSCVSSNIPWQQRHTWKDHMAHRRFPYPSLAWREKRVGGGQGASREHWLLRVGVVSRLTLTDARSTASRVWCVRILWPKIYQVAFDKYATQSPIDHKNIYSQYILHVLNK